MIEAKFYQKLPEEKVKCNLCTHHCIIPNFKNGICGVRENRNGTLYTLNYGKLVTQHVDLIEKKPLFHFYPGSRTYSIATRGCNFKCAYCQNYEISQIPVQENLPFNPTVNLEIIVSEAIRSGCKSIAYTFTEPTIFYEYALEDAQLAHEKEIKNIFITNGYITAEALQTIVPYLDAVNVDLKSFSNDFYKKICHAQLQPVLDTLKSLKQLGIWMEVTTLIIPTLNDTEQEFKSIADFLVNLGNDIPWHISAFYPAYKLNHLPPTSIKSLYIARKIGLNTGLRYVYTGNTNTIISETTYCYECGATLIQRRQYQIVNNSISGSRCPICGSPIDGIGLEGGSKKRQHSKYVLNKIVY